MRRTIRTILTILTMTMLTAGATAAKSGNKTRIDHVHPLCWWAGMAEPTFQILLHGEGIGSQEVEIADAEGVKIAEIIRPENTNYLIIYVDASGAPAQTFTIRVGKLKVPYELRVREDLGRKNWDASDVVYLLMPDRFAQGQTEEALKAGYADMRESTWDRSIPLARHGGDIAGMQQHLDYLADLGVTALWPTPVLVNDMEKESYHGYAITDYYQVDSRMGTNEDYRRFVQAAHERGIKVIQDIVFNHCGSGNFLYTDMPDSTWFNNDGHYIQSTYRTGAVGDIHASRRDRQLTVDGWFVPAMPDLCQRNQLVRDYLVQASIWWIEYAGIDGIRQDTYPYCDYEAMRYWNERIQQEYPGFNIVGETWINNNVGVSYWQKDSRLAAPLNSLLPTVMDFPLMTLLNCVVDEETDEWNSGYARLYEYLSQDRVYADPLHLLTFLDNHDTDRFQKTAEQAGDTTRYKHALTLLLTLRGIPQLYYGDEIGMAANKSKGDGALRQDFPGGWADDTANAFTAQGRTALQEWYHRFTRNLLQWRKGSKAACYGELVHFSVRHGVYVYARVLGDEVVTVLANGTSKGQTVALEPYREVLPKDRATNVLTHRPITLADSMHLGPREIRVLDFK